jgi:hypothetical protein
MSQAARSIHIFLDGRKDFILTNRERPAAREKLLAIMAALR